MATVLIVDDSVEIQALLEMWLVAMGHKAIKISDGYNAVQEFTKFRPDLVILDYNLPAASGTQVYQRIRSLAHGTRVPVIFLSATSPAELMFVVPEKDLVRFLSKPLDLKVFSQTIAEMLPAPPPLGQAPPIVPPPAA